MTNEISLCNDFCIYFPCYHYLSIVHSIRKSVATIFLGGARAGLKCGVSAEVKEENRVGEEREGEITREKKRKRGIVRRMGEGYGKVLATRRQARAPAR